VKTIWLTEREAQALEGIESDDLNDIVSLVERIGFDARTFFERRNCDGLDFRGSALTNISFEKANLNGAQFYSDQFELVRSTGPAHFDRVVVHLREETEGNTELRAPDTQYEELSESTRSILQNWASNQQKDLNFSILRQPEKVPAFEHFFTGNRSYVTSLVLSNSNVEDLSPLTYVTELKDLQLNDTKVRNLVPISQLPNLTSLSLSRSLVTDLRPITNLIHLQVLRIQGTQIVDLSPLRGISGLHGLFAGNSSVVDLAPIAGLRLLQQLNIGGTSVEDISPISMFEQLTVLALAGVRAKDFFPIYDLPILRDLNLKNTPISSLAGIGNLETLRHLTLSGTCITDLTPISQLRHLETLDLTDTIISDLRPLANLERLTELNMNGSNAIDLGPLSKLKNLRSLRLLENPVVDLTPLKELTNLNVYVTEASQAAALIAVNPSNVRVYVQGIREDYKKNSV
jgi:Leucine-rich repeat (LRR) protein